MLVAKPDTPAVRGKIGVCIDEYLVKAKRSGARKELSLAFAAGGVPATPLVALTRERIFKTFKRG